MRPTGLDFLFSSIGSLRGVGTKTASLIQKIATDATNREARIHDLLFILPYSTIDRRNQTKIAHTLDGEISTLEVSIDNIHKASSRGHKALCRIHAHDNTGRITIIFFGTAQNYLEKLFTKGESIVISGRIRWFNNQISMIHPDYMVKANKVRDIPSVEPIYSLTTGLSVKTLRKTILTALDRLPIIPEWQSTERRQKNNFLSFEESLRLIHNPSDPLDCLVESPPWRRLAYDELFSGQIALALVRERMRGLSGRSLAGDNSIVQSIINSLPWPLTKSQEKAFKEIDTDLTSPKRMLRLLQGDVGSGKTIIALLAMARAAESKKQAALMAPTEILARQHLAIIQKFTEATGLRANIITAREKGPQRKEILSYLKEGSIDIITGTHALFQDMIKFHDLALVVIDEQHRFGVHQRLALTEKGNATDMLVMTATPIPRTLMLTTFGDMDVSKITEKPLGRKKIHTATLPLARLDEIIERIDKALQRRQKIYWICPLVEESENKNLISVTERFNKLQKIFGQQIGLIHGKMPNFKKDEAILSFREGITRLLVATSIIEVGVDVPDASIIVIENAEQFGLAQLHQLRGRVGRGDEESSCVLLYGNQASEIAKQRLSIMKKTENGFIIAEEDLKLRGQGELLGARQSGSPDFRIARLETHFDLIQTAQDDARALLEEDPKLISTRGKAVRGLLYLFGRDQALRLIQSG